MNINIGSVARECREYLGLTQREAAKALGISVVHLCNIEKGRAKPSADLADKFTDIWGVDLYVFAWCQNGSVSNLPESMKTAAQALTEGWKEQLIAARDAQDGP